MNLKLLHGLTYQSRDPGLIEHYHQARSILKQLNNLNSRAAAAQKSLLEKLLEGIRDNSTIGAGSVVSSDIPESVLAVGNPCQAIDHLDR